MWLIVILLAVGFYMLLNYHQTRQKLLAIQGHFKGPQTQYFLGNFPIFIGKSVPEIFNIITKMHKVYGEDIAIIAAFNELVLDLSSSENVEKVLQVKSFKKSFVYDFLQPWLGTGLLTVPTGEKWFQRRRIITPTFHFKMLESFLDVFNKEADILVEKLGKRAGGEEFDIYDYVTLYALDSICETSMGVQIHAQDDPNNEYAVGVKQMSNFILRRIFSPFRQFPSVFFLYPFAKEQAQLIKRLHNFTNSVIDSRRQMLEQESNREVAFDPQEEDLYSKRKMTFLDLLLSVTVEGNPLSREDIREEVDTFMFEGHDTTTSGISFMLWHLAKYQDVQQKLFEEIDRILGNEKKTVKLSNVLIQEFEYLDMVMKESLRLIPPVPIIGRKLVEDLEMNGTTIPAGTQINLKIYNIHRNPKIWPDPEKFDPERFSKTNESKRGPYDFIPFSAGSRNCIGQRYAMMELKVTIVKLLANFRVLPGESMAKMRFKTDLVIRPEKDIPIKLVARE